MLSHLHEVLLDLFRHSPDLAPEVLATLLGMTLPTYQEARLGDPEVVELRPVAHRADAVVVLRDGPRAVLAVVVEVQLRRDEDKPWTWPEYVVGVRRRLRCPTVLLVVCADTDTARWARAPIGLGGPGSQVLPHVLGPEAVPVLTDAAAAAHAPELSVLSAVTHVGNDGPFEVLEALVGALDHVEVGQAVEYARMVLAALPDIARGHLEELMATETYEYQSDFTRRLEARGEARGQARGQAEGRVAMLLKILAGRGITITTQARDRITACTDLDQLETWGDRALTAESIESLFS